jgi:hypothetical protein
MPKIGKYDYPAIGIRAALDALEAISKSKVATLAGVAQVLGHKTINSGTFLLKIGAMSKHYGILDRRGQDVVLTPLGRRIAHSDNPAEKDDAIREMIVGIPIFRDLFQRLGPDYDREQFQIHLRELAGIERGEATEETSRIRNLYDEALPYLRRAKAVSIDSSPGKDGNKMKDEADNRAGTTYNGAGMNKLEIFGKPPVIVPDKEHYVESLIKDLQEHLVELKKKAAEVQPIQPNCS